LGSEVGKGCWLPGGLNCLRLDGVCLGVSHSWPRGCIQNFAVKVKPPYIITLLILMSHVSLLLPTAAFGAYVQPQSPGWTIDVRNIASEKA